MTSRTNSQLVSRGAGTFLFCGQRGVFFDAHVADAVHLGGDVRVPVEHEAGGVSVRAHIFKNQPVANLGSLKLSLVQCTNLVKAVTRWAKNSGRDSFSSCVTSLPNGRCKSDWHGVVVVVNDIVEGAIDAVVYVEGLCLTFTAFSAVDFSSNRC